MAMSKPTRFQALSLSIAKRKPVKKTSNSSNYKRNETTSKTRTPRFTQFQDQDNRTRKTGPRQFLILGLGPGKS